MAYAFVFWRGIAQGWPRASVRASGPLAVLVHAAGERVST